MTIAIYIGFLLRRAETVMQHSAGQCYPESGPLANGAADPDMPAMGFDDFMDNSQTETGAFGFCRKIGIEDLLLIGCADPLAGVGNLNDGAAALQKAAYGQFSAGFHGLNGVQMEVQKTLQKTIRIQLHGDTR